MVRKYVVPDMLDDLDAQNRAVALLKGWQVRKIVSCGEVAAIIRKIQEITTYQRQAMNDPNAANMIPILAHNRKCEVLNFLITIHRLSQTGEWIKSKRINPNAAYYQRYMMQQNQYQTFLPYFNPSMFLNQSLQLPNPPVQLSMDQTQPVNRASLPQTTENMPIQYFHSPDRASPISKHHSPENLPQSVEKGSPRPYDTANEQVPLPKPKNLGDEPVQTRFEFDNEDFNVNSKFAKGKKR